MGGACGRAGSFAESLRDGTHAQWFAAHLPKWPKDASPERVIGALLLVKATRRRLEMYQCEQCGRMWLQRPDEPNEFRAYLPGKGDWADALRVPQR